MTAPTPRTTSALVQGLIETQVGWDLTPFIATANYLTTDLCTYATLPYTDGFVGSRMELIERWLAAHFYTVFDNQIAAAKAGTVHVNYQWKTDMDLRASMYGQQAIMLDTQGGLAKYVNSAKEKRQITLTVSWLGIRRNWCYDRE